MFGQSVGFQIKGKETFGTLVGALMTVTVVWLALAFGYYKFLVLYYRKDTNYSSIISSGALDSNT